MIKRSSDSKTKILIGICLLVLVIIYCSNSIISHLALRVFDLVCWSVMIITGIVLIVEGTRLNKR